MRISIFEDYQIFDAGKGKNIDIVLSRFPEIKDIEVVIDFSNCLVDYPATSKLIDKALVELAKVGGKKELKAISDLAINNESLILSLMIGGSGYFDFSGLDRTSEASKYSKIMCEKLKENDIVFKISLLKDDGDIFKEFKYG